MMLPWRSVFHLISQTIPIPLSRTRSIRSIRFSLDVKRGRVASWNHVSKIQIAFLAGALSIWGKVCVQRNAPRTARLAGLAHRLERGRIWPLFVSLIFQTCANHVVARRVAKPRVVRKMSVSTTAPREVSAVVNAAPMMTVPGGFHAKTVLP